MAKVALGHDMGVAVGAGDGVEAGFAFVEAEKMHIRNYGNN